MKQGRVSERIFKRSILKKISFKRSETSTHAGVGEYCAVLNFSENASTVVSSDTIADCSLGNERNLIIRVINNLATKGATPVSADFSIVLPEDYDENELKKLMDRLVLITREFDIEITNVKTKVSKKVSDVVLSVTVTGNKDRAFFLSGARPGDDIVVSKCIGLEGTSLIAKRKQDEILEKFPSHMVTEAINFDKRLSILPEAATAVKSGVSAMLSLSEGGIFAGLWELGEASGVGLEIDLRKIPVKQETIEIANLIDINPYALLSGGSLLMTASDGNKLVMDLNKQGIESCIIGKCTDSNDRVLLNEEVRRFLELDVEDEIYKVL